MNENPNRLTTIKVKEFSEVFEKTLLEISILDSLYGSSNVSDYVKNVFRASIEELQDSGTLQTLSAIIYSDEREYEKNEQKDERILHRRCTNDEQFMEDYVSLEKKVQMLEQEDEEIESMIEKCTVSSIDLTAIITKLTHKH